MARSGYVYVVSDRFGPITAFTVKHELVRWLRGLSAEVRASHTALRMPDGVRANPKITVLDIEELLS